MTSAPAVRRRRQRRSQVVCAPKFGYQRHGCSMANQVDPSAPCLPRYISAPDFNQEGRTDGLFGFEEASGSVEVRPRTCRTGMLLGCGVPAG